MSEETIPTGHITELGILNLLAAKTPEDFKGITRISEVGMILVPEHLSMELMKIPMSEVGTVAPIPSGESIHLQVGQMKTTGEALSGGDPERLLVVVGQLFISTPITTIGYKGISVVGQIFATRGSEAVLGAKLTNINGQVFYLPENPRLYFSDDTISAEFLDLLPAPVALVVMSTVTIEPEVSVDLLKSKVTEIVLFGTLRVPASLLSIAKVLTVERFGEIQSTE